MENAHGNRKQHKKKNEIDMYFDELPLADEILDALDSMNFEQCTPIQEKTIPVLLEGKDLIGVAQTGTGKTAAYLLPVLNKLHTGNYPKDAINCVIMSPTRELAQQIDQQVEGFAYFQPISSVAVYGGNDGMRFEQERKGLSLGADIIIATPGRLISHIATGNVDLSKVSFFILDEADRMLDMGFYDDIMKIVSYLPKERQTVMFSATMPENIQKLAKSILSNPVEIKIAVSKPAENIKQIAYICYEDMKQRIIEKILKEENLDKAIVFASSKLKVKEMARILSKCGLDVGAMHSDLTQAERDEIMYNFKNGKINILVATDIISRGIDIDDIQMVINYDVPRDSEDYVHRIGRTARANRTGQAITLVCPQDFKSFNKIEKLIGTSIEKPKLPENCGKSPEYTIENGKENKNKAKGRNNPRRKNDNRTQHKTEGKNRRNTDKQAEKAGEKTRSRKANYNRKVRKSDNKTKTETGTKQTQTEGSQNA